MISLEDTDTANPWRRRVVKAVRGDMSAAVSVIEARGIEVVYIDWSCVVRFSDEGDTTEVWRLVMLQDMCKKARVVVCYATKVMAYIGAEAVDGGKVEVEDEVEDDTAI